MLSKHRLNNPFVRSNVVVELLELSMNVVDPMAVAVHTPNGTQRRNLETREGAKGLVDRLFGEVKRMLRVMNFLFAALMPFS